MIANEKATDLVLFSTWDGDLNFESETVSFANICYISFELKLWVGKSICFASKIKISELAMVCDSVKNVLEVKFLVGFIIVLVS